jgi:hypothetical protein
MSNRLTKPYRHSLILTGFRSIRTEYRVANNVKADFIIQTDVELISKALKEQVYFQILTSISYFNAPAAVTHSVSPIFVDSLSQLYYLC